MEDDDLKEPLLFELPPGRTPEPKTATLESPLWTEHKAHLIERYLYYFVLVTKHGDYIDGFAGPQEADRPEMWSAKLVLESEPRWFRKFFLFDDDADQAARLEALKAAQPPQNAAKREPRRTIEVQRGDFNVLVHELLQSRMIGENEATFCLLDQRTFECGWATLEALARYKAGHKIELFYFLPNMWFDRAISGLKDTGILTAWWGRADWPQITSLAGDERVRRFAHRVKHELGYASVKAWPIYERQGGGHIMYYMLHATDHPVAPGLMSRAYRRAVTPREPIDQLALEFGLSSVAPLGE